MGLGKTAFFGLLGPLIGLTMQVGADVGFAPIDGAAAPEAVIASARRSYELWAPAGDYQEVPAARYVTLEESLKASLASNTAKSDTAKKNMRTAMHIRVNLAELRFCRRHGDSLCLLSTLVSRGSAFVVHDATLVTARHALSNRVRLPDKTTRMDGISARLAKLAEVWERQIKEPKTAYQAQTDLADFTADPLRDTVFVLTDLTGAVVYDSSLTRATFRRYGALATLRGNVNVDGGRVKIGIAGDEAAAEALTPSGPTWVTDDIVMIALGFSLPSVPVARTGCDPGDPAYIAGFPAATRDRFLVGGGVDAIDRTLSLTLGRYLTIDEAIRLGRDWSANANFANSLRGRAGLLADADGAVGMSGGMMLNQSGEVCGLFKGIISYYTPFKWDASLDAWKMYTLGARLAPGSAE
jgi:hypothetical protein